METLFSGRLAGSFHAIKVEIQLCGNYRVASNTDRGCWIPAFAGMTILNLLTVISAKAGIELLDISLSFKATADLLERFDKPPIQNH
jgi:hypothetical protein